MIQPAAARVMCAPPSACTADTLPFREPSVLWAEGVSMLAVSQCTSGCHAAGPNQTPAHVLRVGDQFEVAGPNATCHAAEVVVIHSRLRAANKEVMRTHLVEDSIPVVIRGSTPKPARVSLIDKFPEALGGFSQVERLYRYVGAYIARGLPALVVRMAPTASNEWLITAFNRACAWAILGLHRATSGVMRTAATTARPPSILREARHAL